MAGGATAGAVIDPSEVARTYVTSNPLDPIHLDGEVGMGARAPQTVVLQLVPDYEYRYVYINGQPVLVHPPDRLRRSLRNRRAGTSFGELESGPGARTENG